MAEQNEHEPRTDGVTPHGPGGTTGPADGPAPAAPADRPVAPAGGAVPPSAAPTPGGGGPHTETLESRAVPPPYGGDAPPSARSRWSGRWRRWSASGAVRMGVVAIVAGLIGGLVGGGVVAAFSDDGHDRPGPARFERGVPPGFGGYYGRGPNGRWAPPNRRNMPWPGRPGASGRPAPEPSPKTTG